MAAHYTNRPRAFRAHRPHLETLGEYSARVLRYALIAGLHTLTPEQRAQADTAAQRATSQITGPGPEYLASKVDAPGLRTLERLRDLRHQIARYAQTEQAARSLPAAPQPPQDTTGGKGARLIPPTPTRPPAGAQVVAYAPPPPQVEIAF